MFIIGSRNFQRHHASCKIADHDVPVHVRQKRGHFAIATRGRAFHTCAPICRGPRRRRDRILHGRQGQPLGASARLELLPAPALVQSSRRKRIAVYDGATSGEFSA